MILDLVKVSFTEEEKNLLIQYRQEKDKLTSEIFAIDSNFTNFPNENLSVETNSVLAILLEKKKQIEKKEQEIELAAISRCSDKYKNNLDLLREHIKQTIDAITLEDYKEHQEEIFNFYRTRIKENPKLKKQFTKNTKYGYDSFVAFVFQSSSIDDVIVDLDIKADKENDDEQHEKLNVLAYEYINLVADKACLYFAPPQNAPTQDTKKSIPINLQLFGKDNGAYLLQGKFTNNLAAALTPANKINEIKKLGKTHSNLANRANITSSNDFTITTNNAADFKGLKVSTSMLFDMAILALAKQPATDREVFIPLDTYMEIRNLKDKKSARQTVKDDLDTLFNLSLSFKDKIKGEDADFKDIRIITSKGIKNSIISIKFSEDAESIIRNYYSMYIPKELLAIDNNKFPHSYQLGRKILELKRTNIGNDRIISVETLLNACSSIPTYETVSNTQSKAYRQRIIEPFEDNLNYFTSFSWEYCKAKGEPFTQEELDNFNIRTFLKSYIKVTFNDYPTNQELIDKKTHYKNSKQTNKKKTTRKKN